MKIALLIPGSGDNFYCENCYRDSALYQALRKAGEEALAIPLYLPPQLEHHNAGQFHEIFFGGINVYLQQKYKLFRRTPRWLDRLLDSPRLLGWVAKKAGMTDAVTLAQTTLSMLKGAHGHQVKELERLIDWLAEQEKPDVICLSNYLLAGLAGQIRARLRVPVACFLQDEDEFLDELPEPYRAEAWQLLRDYVPQIDLFIAPSQFYAEAMTRRLNIPPAKMAVVYNGIDPEKYQKAKEKTGDWRLEAGDKKLGQDALATEMRRQDARDMDLGQDAQATKVPAIGYLSRMSAPKGLDLLAEAFIQLKQQPGQERLELHIDGGMTALDAPFVNQVRGRLTQAGVINQVKFTHFKPQQRLEFLAAISVLSVPERRASAGGFYVLEALARGVPVVQPDTGVFPELKSRVGSGITIFKAADVADLTRQLAAVLHNSTRQEAQGPALQNAVFQQFNVSRQAEGLVGLLQKLLK